VQSVEGDAVALRKKAPQRASDNSERVDSTGRTSVAAAASRTSAMVSGVVERVQAADDTAVLVPAR
jgi:hypothetical protein